MAFSSVFVRCVAAFLLAVLGACSSLDEEEIFGYEENFVIPQPDMVPVTPDDKPGRTVDEMLDLKQSVAVKRAVYPEQSESDRMYEHVGRFGSKEKISLRKGLNAPDAGIIYGTRKRRDASVVRPLELKEREKDKLLAVSEEEMLAEIIAPKAENIEMIEVISVVARPDGVPVERLNVASDESVSGVAVVDEPDLSERSVVVKQTSVLPAVTLKAPDFQEKKPEPLVLSEPVIKLIPPDAKNKIVLTSPSGESSIEIFLEE